jgi:2-keto-4-pentenoate hydratase/2-oxohepta-3-ene-1,7-dioic acid hydratase in catechol pathway
MKICRFNADRIGVVVDDAVYDATRLLDTRPRWPLPPCDWVVQQLPGLLPRIEREYRELPQLELAALRLESPVANPGKIIGAPINYQAHIEEANRDSTIHQGKTFTSLDRFGLFLKAGSSLIGPSDSVRLRFPERRSDHEVELAVIIGTEARFVSRAHALEHVLGYCIGLDMTVRGPEFPDYRKSIDTYTVLGPWLVTADEIGDPGSLELSLRVNGEFRQRSSTRRMIFDVPRLIEYASQFYTLHPGDVILTGTPEGVSQVQPGDLMHAHIERIGEMQVRIDPLWAGPST